MTPTEGFEAWFQEIPFVERPANNIWFGKDAWLAACAFQRERDAEIADQLADRLFLANHDEVSAFGTKLMKELGKKFAVAIRAQEGR